MENQLDNKELAKEYAKFTLKRDWPQIEATIKLYSARSLLMTRGTGCTKRR
jgi:hypothetical protein